MKNTNIIYLLTLIIISCNNTPKTSITSADNNVTIQQKRIAYLQKKDWVAPEDMELFKRGITPLKERGFWDEDKRKQAFMDKLKKLNIPDSMIKHVADEVDQIHGGRTGQWNYEYIQARFEADKHDMAEDEEWKKIEAEYQNRTKPDKK